VVFSPRARVPRRGALSGVAPAVLHGLVMSASDQDPTTEPPSSDAADLTPAVSPNAYVLAHESSTDESFFTDDGAKIVWAAVRALDEGRKHQLLDLLAAHLAVPESEVRPSRVRVARAIGALREANRLNVERGQGVLRQEDYRSLHADVGEGQGWPSDSSVRRWLGGGWEHALRQAHLPIPDSGDAAIAEIGQAYSGEECLQALRDYLVEPGALTIPDIHSVINWARRPDVRRRPGRRPRSQGPYDRLFGSWNAVLREIGVVSSDLTTGAAVGGREAGVSVPPRAARYTSDDFHAALEEVATRLGRSPKSHEYHDERLLIFRDEQAKNLPPRAMPSASVIFKVYASWDEALIDAGLSPARGRQNARRPDHVRNPRRYSEEQLLAAVRSAFLKMGQPFTRDAYLTWRRREIAAARSEPGSDQTRRIPEYTVLSGRFGSWAAACDRAGVERSARHRGSAKRRRGAPAISLVPTPAAEERP
jgi:hypothetical protein